ncbi:hypothetical protein GY977_23390, partial [Escherichia coli]|nr:hypothetical protein [Escherichia coli]
LPDVIRPVEAYLKIDELPFDFVRRRLSVVVEDAEDRHLIVCKGAVEEMLGIAHAIRDGGVVRPLGDAERHTLIARARAMNAEGF